MKIFKLTPLDPENPHWRASIYKGEVIVRAENGDRARHIACLALGGYPELNYSKPLPQNPWSVSTGTTTCQVLENSEFEAKGEEALLSPAKYDQNWRR